ncbi:MAG: hypothetical protein K2X43_13520 [Hyphomonadaceae bacterium]|jgi:glutathione synthase/RimK-type ligase-like ATP-grasp enzyme|nr:hypothetical protein [Hyphomonadaceae bacterium]
MSKYAIILSSADDVHACAVAAEIMTALKGRALILDTAHYPEHWRLTARIGNGRRPSWLLRAGQLELADHDVAGVWWRRPKSHRIPGAVKDRKVRRFCAQEAAAAFTGWIYGLGPKVVNPLAAELVANKKPYQLLMAKEIGLRVPETAITNDPKEAQSFVARQSGGAIFKVLTATSWTFANTRQFKRSHARHLRTLRFAPIILQEYIDVDYDIRATIVDDDIFCVSLKTEHPRARIDWRLDLSAAIEPHTLSRTVEARLKRLMRGLGLRFGAIDLRLTPEGEYVFLEVNPSGQFLFCDIHGGQSITVALARALLGLRPAA